ncbi:MAG: hypothetical protein ACLRFK_02290 [Alphaproteobacteria bacterium]
MKKLLILIANILVCMSFADAAVRDGTAVSRAGKSEKTQSRVATTNVPEKKRTTVLAPRATKTNVSRDVKDSRANNTVKTRSATMHSATPVTQKSVVSRAGTTAAATSAVSGTRTGAEYEQCKNAYFACMDQFCTLKNDDYRRCSCNDRVFDLVAQRETLEDANVQLTEFTENLETVGMTAQQVIAMKTASDGENALTSDKSASKALLQAIMNSIRGDDANVVGKYSDLNSINLSFDTANAFGMTDTGQAIAAYNGQALYSAVYPQCRQAVRDTCTDASLQRAITAYLMAVEQDCNIVQSAIDTTRGQLKAAVREGGAMLDLARVENYQKHNSSDLATCISEIESAILSEEVCGANYHKCLDNGKYIDVATGKPIIGVTDFYKLGEMLTFASGVQTVDQKLSKLSANQQFVLNFESRVKVFAQPALDKCVDLADVAWSDYLDKALLDIHYAQQAKVAEIKQGCFDFVSSCYVRGDKSITDAMQSLTSGNEIVVVPEQIVLNNKMCSDYVESCNSMFRDGDEDKNIIADYIKNQTETDLLASCRAVVQQCFDKYGGLNYINFYDPNSGLSQRKGWAPDWFTLYNGTYQNDKFSVNTPDKPNRIKKWNIQTDGAPSPCLVALIKVDACRDPDGDNKYSGTDSEEIEDEDFEFVERVFGGFDQFYNVGGFSKYNKNLYTIYGLAEDNELKHRWLRPVGVATEVYNKIISILSTQCMNLDGKFVEYQNAIRDYRTDNLCAIGDFYDNESNDYGISADEIVCPANYAKDVDTESWGICSCWENDHRRSKNGTTTKCEEVYFNSSNGNSNGDSNGDSNGNSNGDVWQPMMCTVNDGCTPPNQ